MNKSKGYSNLKYKLALADIVFNLIFLTITQLSGLSHFIQTLSLNVSNKSIFIISIYIFILGLIYYAAHFPLNYCGSFAVEHKFNLSQQKISGWFKDQAKTMLIGYTIAVILIFTLYYLINHFAQSWWILTACAWILFSFVFAKIFPVVIIPLFFKYKPIKDEGLKERILKLAEKFKIKLLDVFEIDFSKKTLKANAAFVGFGKQKRVILADTLKEKYSGEEIESILAHEFAHYKFRHLWKLFLVNSLSTIILFYLIFKSATRIINQFNIFALGEIETLPIILIYMAVFGIITAPLMNFISRVFEKEADLSAVKQTSDPAAFCSTMNKLAEQNLSDRKPHPLIKFFFFDHPPIDERINYIK